MIRSRRAQGLPLVKTLFILFLSTVVFISWVLILQKADTFHIDERKINTQLVISKAISGECFSNEYGAIDPTLFDQNSVDNCFRGLDDNVLVRMKFSGESYDVFDREREFNEKAVLCARSSTMLCSEMKYPVRSLKGNSEGIDVLTLQVIVTGS